MSATQWQPLLALVEASRMAAETRLAQWRRYETEIADAIERLDASAATDLTGDDTLRRAGADLRWQAWCDARRTALLSDLAQVRYRRTAAEEAVRHAAARFIATEAVASTERKRAQRLQASRDEREGRG
jgi:hypothetical protein